MSDPAPRFLSVGHNFLKAGDTAIHFYYSPAEQCRFAGYLQEALDRGAGVIVATAGENHPLLLSGVLRPPRLARHNNFTRLRVTADLRGTVGSLGQAAAALAQRFPELRMLVDFDGLVSSENIFEVEADLHRRTRGLRLVVVSQYDGNALPAAITLEQFQTHGVTIVGNIFYSENRNITAPDQYARTRLQKSAAATASGMK
jgi:hypothetical protein